MSVYRNPDFLRLPDRLAAMFAHSAQDSFFALPGWYELMARHGVPPESEVRLYSNERPGAAAALALRVVSGHSGRRLASLTNAYSVEHAVLLAPGADPAAGLGAIAGELAAERPHWDAISLDELDPGAPSYRAAVAALRRAGLFVECVFHSGTWYEETAGMDFTRYLALRPSALRNTWRRKRRKLGSGGRLKIHFFTTPCGIDEAIAGYEAVYAQSWKRAEAYPAFIPALIRFAAAKGALRLGLATLDGRPAAAQFWILWNGRAVIYKLAHDQRLDEYSLGTLLTMEMIERVLAEDHPREINFGRGDDPYKRLWLAKRRERWGIVAANPRTGRGLGIGLRGEAAKLWHRLRGAPAAARSG
ncbi:MAG TPA: GNAT family N-acetyltransferase [Stellaceae bacterium]|nr:GNAT family N-acetyltransferase [Stellaceae bacterium]